MQQTGMSLTTSVTVVHRNPQHNEKFGVGVVIGSFINNETQFQVDENGEKFADPENEGEFLLITTPVLYYNVLWEAFRIPTLISASDLEWINVIGVTDDEIELDDLEESLRAFIDDEDKVQEILELASENTEEDNDDEDFELNPAPAGTTQVSAPATDQ